jgi:hypothetical protein
MIPVFQASTRSRGKSEMAAVARNLGEWRFAVPARVSRLQAAHSTQLPECTALLLEPVAAACAAAFRRLMTSISRTPLSRFLLSSLDGNSARRRLGVSIVELFKTSRIRGNGHCTVTSDRILSFLAGLQKHNQARDADFLLKFGIYCGSIANLGNGPLEGNQSCGNWFSLEI